MREFPTLRSQLTPFSSCVLILSASCSLNSTLSRLLSVPDQRGGHEQASLVLCIRYNANAFSRHSAQFSLLSDNSCPSCQLL